MAALRWQGLVALAALLLLFGWIWFMAVDPFIKRNIINSAEALTGARVELSSVDLSLFPLGVTLYDMAVADRDKPMRNIFEFTEARIHLDLLKLMLGHVVIDDLSVDALRLGTQRTHSGALPNHARDSGGAESSAAGQLMKQTLARLPDPADILARENLLVVARANDLQDSYAAEQGKIDQLQARLPDARTVQDFEFRTRQLTQGKVKSVDDFVKRRDELVALKKDIHQAQQHVTMTIDQYNISYQILDDKVQTLRQAPADDLKRLKEKYLQGARSLPSVSGLLFGQESEGWVRDGLYWYQRAQPLLQSRQHAPARAEGRNIHFPTAHPLPDFLIRKVGVDVRWSGSQLKATVRNVTTQPERLGRPMTLAIRAENLLDVAGFEVNGVFDRTYPGHRQDAVNFAVHGIALKDVQVLSAEQLPIVMQSAVTELSGDIGINDQQLQAHLTGDFSKVRFTSDADSGLAAEVVHILQQIDQFIVMAEVKGELGEPALSLSSDLDDKLRSQISDRILAREREVEADLSRKLNSRSQEVSAEYQGKLTEFRRRVDTLQATQNQLQQLLDAKVDEFRSQADDQLDKAKRKLKQKLPFGL
ncbi:MAG: TIGR03545 family protein [Gammaproteobacteria bacterium]|nr:TIGR03545 family protein [Gammaproteobacteria bacterium]